MKQIQTFQYNGSPITFNIGEAVMVNATEMAKPFGKEAKHWLLNQSTKEFIEELANVRNLTFADLVQVRKGSPENGSGSWMHEDVALEFARWLSPAFAIWCNDRIKELLTHGMTATPSTLDAIVDNPDLLIKLATQLKEERAEKEKLQMESEQQQKLIEEQNGKLEAAEPAVAFTKAVSASKSSCLIGELPNCLANELLNMEGSEDRV